MSIAKTIRVAHSYFMARQVFFSRLVENIDNPELLKALEVDGVSTDGIWACPDEAYNQLNVAGTKTRDWMISHV